MNTSFPRADARGFDSIQFRRALSQFATGVTVITTRLADGTYRGLTASSFNSVSLDPPLVLWSLANKARSMPAFRHASHFIVNVLASHQLDLALRFSRDAGDRFAGLAYERSEAGLPILPGAAAWFECRSRSRYLEGDHVIFVGQVEHCRASPARPLGFHGGKFIAF